MYTIKFYKGDYSERQKQANADKCVGYVEQHFNAVDDPSVGYAITIVGSNASRTSQNWGRWYASAVAKAFGVRDRGIKIGGFGGRGDANIRKTNMPAILLEPLFASNPRHAEHIRNETGQDTLASILADSIRRFFPNGGLIGFSVGHKYKKSRPNDRGARVVGGGMEADFAEDVLEKAAMLLAQVTEEPEKREIRVMQGSKVLWKQEIDEDANVRWDDRRGILRIADV